MTAHSRNSRSRSRSCASRPSTRRASSNGECGSSAAITRPPTYEAVRRSSSTTARRPAALRSRRPRLYGNAARGEWYSRCRSRLRTADAGSSGHSRRSCASTSLRISLLSAPGTRNLRRPATRRSSSFCRAAAHGHDVPAAHRPSARRNGGLDWSRLNPRPVSIPAAQVTLSGDLRSPPEPAGLVIFAHGSGSSRLSPRNVQVASALGSCGFATLLFDLRDGA